ADRIFQIAKFAFGAAHFKLIVAAIHRQAGRIVTTIFQPFQPFQDDGNGLLCSDVPHYSAHTTNYSGANPEFRSGTPQLLDSPTLHGRLLPNPSVPALEACHR